MKYTYTIPFIPPSNNQFIGRENRWEYQNVKREWLGYISLLCRPRPKKPISKAAVSIQYTFKDNRRRDPDNYSGKMILDGLVRCGILVDDSFDNIDLTVRKEDVDRNNPKTVITIEEI